MQRQRSCKDVFSVAQHCINCAIEAEKRGYNNRVITACLIHDASEAYMSDVPRPFKKSLDNYKKAEKHLLDLIYTKFLGSPLNEKEEEIVKSIDDDMLYFDLKYLLNEQMNIPKPKINIEINYEVQPFISVEELYLKLYNKYNQ